MLSFESITIIARAAYASTIIEDVPMLRGGKDAVLA